MNVVQDNVVLGVASVHVPVVAAVGFERPCVARRRVVVFGSTVLLLLQLLHRQHRGRDSFFVVLRVVGVDWSFVHVCCDDVW